METTHDLSEDATFFVTAKYLRTRKDGSESIDYYEAKPLKGRYAFSLKMADHYSGKDGTWFKKVDNWQDSGMLEDKLTLLLTINRKTKEYAIHSQIITTSKEGTSEQEWSNGQKLRGKASESWAINGAFDVEGKTDGKAVSGNWSKPATAQTAVIKGSGMVSGAVWNWSLKRVGE